MSKIWHRLSSEKLFDVLESNANGLTSAEARERLARYGRNTLPRRKAASLRQVVLRQFASPFIYLLSIAALVSFFLGEFTDAGFIAFVLFLNAGIGSAQEYKAERSAEALQGLLKVKAHVERDGETYEIDNEEVVPGDLVYLESGYRVPADVRLVTTRELAIDESLLTGESVPVEKQSSPLEGREIPLADRNNMAYAGTITARGRGKGLVVATGLHTELGRIATDIAGRTAAKPPLLVRMAQFTRMVAVAVGMAVAILAVVGTLRGQPPSGIFLLAVALFVSAIPEGLPIALTVALSIASLRMARRNVIVRKLVSVEGLGSCTLIGTDKTGTLTCNEMTVQRIAIPGRPFYQVTGTGYVPEGNVTDNTGRALTTEEIAPLYELATAVSLANEASLFRRDSEWHHKGDPTDVALLVFSHKMGMTQAALEERFRTIDTIPFEPERRYAAVLVENEAESRLIAKGAIETLLPLCDRMLTSTGEAPIDRQAVEDEAAQLARDGFRVLAVARRVYPAKGRVGIGDSDLSELVFLGCVGMKDPLRPGVAEAINQCHQAGIQVVMITGDHPLTALAIGQELGMAREESDVVTGAQLAQCPDVDALARLVTGKTIFARVEPHQKLAIVRAFQQQGHFVAVTGDGVNDAPALKEAHIGVAMGKQGTDVAREASDLVITDDDFASIVNGVEEGRVAYDNVRKVIYLLVSTGAAEIVLFTLSVLFNSPLPLLPAQILWLNLVTNGIQDVALAFEPNEGGVLARPPRRPQERIFNRLMIERTLLAAAVMGSLSYLVFHFLLSQGADVTSARNFTLLLMVLFENVHIGDCRSETKSVFALSPFRNPLLLWGTLTAQGVHILSLYIPITQTILSVQPVSLKQWLTAFGLALSLIVAMEIYKFFRSRHFLRVANQV